MSEKLYCPIKKYVTEDRLKILIQNCVCYLCTEAWGGSTGREEQIELLKEEIGFTDKELSDLNLEEYLAK